MFSHLILLCLWPLFFCHDPMVFLMKNAFRNISSSIQCGNVCESTLAAHTPHTHSHIPTVGQRSSTLPYVVRHDYTLAARTPRTHSPLPTLPSNSWSVESLSTLLHPACPLPRQPPHVTRQARESNVLDVDLDDRLKNKVKIKSNQNQMRLSMTTYVGPTTPS